MNRSPISHPSPMAAAYRAPPLCLPCAARTASDRVAPARPLACGSSLGDALARRVGLPAWSRALGRPSFPSVSAAKKRRRSQQGPCGAGRAFCRFSGSPEAISGTAWNESVLQSDIPVLVEFWASWCGPCRMVHRIIDELAREYAGRIKLYTLNTDEHPQIASLHSIDRIPTVLIFKNGEKVESLTGTLPKSAYVRAIEKSLSN